MEAYKCDACGKFYEKNRILLDTRANMSGIGIMVRECGATYEIYDLCEECSKKILDMLGVESTIDEEEE